MYIQFKLVWLNIVQAAYTFIKITCNNRLTSWTCMRNNKYEVRPKNNTSVTGNPTVPIKQLRPWSLLFLFWDLYFFDFRSNRRVLIVQNESAKTLIAAYNVHSSWLPFFLDLIQVVLTFYGMHANINLNGFDLAKKLLSFYIQLDLVNTCTYFRKVFRYYAM